MGVYRWRGIARGASRTTPGGTRGGRGGGTPRFRKDFLGIFTINYAAMKYQLKNDQLTQLDGDKARMDISREECRVYLQGTEEKPAISNASKLGFGHATDLHVANFLECVRTRQTPTAPMRVAFQAALVVQMANLSLKHERRIKWNHQTNQVEM